MTPATTTSTLNLAIPKGRMQEGVSRLLSEAGLPLRASSRDYRPTLPLPDADVKVLKPRAVIEMLHEGARDVGFAGADWVREDGAELVELVDTGLNPVRLVAAAPASILLDGALPERPLTVASEYPNITQRWIADRGLDARLLRSFGATEVLPPEDADCIVDNTATGATLAANGLDIIDELMTSSTRLYASQDAMDDASKRDRIEAFAMLVRSVLDARSRVMLEVNVDAGNLGALVAALPCMRQPTVATLHDDSGFAVKAAVRRSELPAVIPALKARGGTDIIVTTPQQILA